MEKHNPVDCKSSAFCKCVNHDECKECKSCTSYRMIDSGYGWCMFLPVPIVVPWCRIPCGNFKEDWK